MCAWRRHQFSAKHLTFTSMVARRMQAKRIWEYCGGLGQQGRGIRANMLRYHILTHALDSQRLNLPSGRINQAEPPGRGAGRRWKGWEQIPDCAGVLLAATRQEK